MKSTLSVFSFLAIVVLTGEARSSKTIISANGADVLAELEDSAIRTLTTCYPNGGKTIALLGGCSDAFVKALSLGASFSLVLLDGGKRAENNVHHWYDDAKSDWSSRNINRKHKVRVVVTMVGSHRGFKEELTTFRASGFYNSAASFLILGWSPQNKHAVCDGNLETIQFFHVASLNNVLNLNLMCREPTYGIVMIGFNPFTKRAPKPWLFVASVKIPGRRNELSYFVRICRDDETMCDNLDFVKTDDLGGATITTVETCPIGEVCSEKALMYPRRDRLWLEMKKRFDFIATFVTHVNATRRYLWNDLVEGSDAIGRIAGIVSRPSHLNGAVVGGSHLNAHGTDCIFLVSQYRGNKSQLEKVLSVIDGYSWIGIGAVALITLGYFKYFLRQPLIVGALNLFRLICSTGLTAQPSNVGSRIYLGGVLFFLLTMHGIFSGNLAALLTHDIAARQIDSIADLADLNYTVYVPGLYLNYFEDAAFDDRVIETLPNENCMEHIEHNPSAACLTWGPYSAMMARKSQLYVSSNCVATVYVTNIVEWQWCLEERLNTVLGILTAGGIMMDFEASVFGKRLLEATSEAKRLEPVIMTLRNLGYAFVVLGIGLGCACVAFIAELMTDRFRRRVTSTRVVVLKRLESR